MQTFGRTRNRLDFVKVYLPTNTDGEHVDLGQMTAPCSGQCQNWEVGSAVGQHDPDPSDPEAPRARAVVFLEALFSHRVKCVVSPRASPTVGKKVLLQR